ncbi:ATPase/histidine kinase/DNA gyrase B/HSP90 domain protein [Aedoeadaptatus nemausensis]|uniref:histidine kinase n=1 Tax=Aedoeadaptatus nemausensis TaxID=2582829 RepID=A0A6V6XZQ4_9FIRM|nr:HAMP domain-containing sensor histidine kinase [Peptoniphilus nemausensis]CAC9924962.1 ATPase/histidine kinase/DNA gyrase B/HSP90 domain protein [Peptoniphilus nemausensis]
MFQFILQKLRRFVYFTVAFSLTFIFLIFVILYINYNVSKQYAQPDSVHVYIMENKGDEFFFTTANRNFLKENNLWAIRIGASGKVIESCRKPSEIPETYNMTDVARFTRYYLKDYPVLTYIVGDELLVIGYPKGTLDKLPFNYYSAEQWLLNVDLALIFLLGYLFFLFFMYRRERNNLFKKLSPLQRALGKIYSADYIPLEEDGPLKDVSRAVNDANRRYEQLSKSQSQWIRGISHDVRTPLSKLSWGLNDLKTEENEEAIEAMEEELMCISKTIQDLNDTSRLQNLSNERFVLKNPIPILRKLLIRYLNENPDRKIIFENKIKESTKIKMDSHLFSRMIENIIKNSLTYQSGDIYVSCCEDMDFICINLWDYGGGVSKEVLERLDTSDLISVNVHGMGLLISKQICYLHGGEMRAENENDGFKVEFTLPISK